MKTHNHYKNTPLKEAVIDIRIDALEQFNEFKVFDNIYDQFKDEYPKRSIRSRAYGRLDLNKDKEISVTGGNNQIGYEYRNVEENQIVFNTKEGFSFHRLAPYDKWETFCPEAKKLWGFYRSQITNLTIKRVAVKYISEFIIPMLFSDFREYLNTFPEYSFNLEQTGLSAFAMQLQIPQPDIHSTLIVTQVMPPDEVQAEKVVVILDIEIFRDQNNPQGEVELWDFFETLRERKNNVFESTITDKMRELIK